MTRSDAYVGVDKDLKGGMTSIGKVVRDAWVFELIPEAETCEGWNRGRIEVLLDSVNAEWDKYGCLVSHLPEDLRSRHERIHAEAIAKSKMAGWTGELELELEAEDERL